MVSVIIVNFNTFTHTSNCIRSVIEYTKDTPYEIVLVDNFSTECPADKFLEIFPAIKLVKSEVNGGFAYGNNLGIQNSTGEYILLLNSDTILEEDTISRSIEYLQQHKETGVLGCRMVFPDGAVQYTARRFRSLGWELLDLFRFIPWLMPYKKRAKRMLGKYFRHDENMEADWVNGAFFLFPRKVLEQLPGKKLDDRFFMYGEDQLWCEQIAKLGYQIHFFAGSTIIHINGGSTDPKKQLQLRRTMMKHELEIMKLREGKGMYYSLFRLVYGTKETSRNFLKSIIFRSSGKMIR